jgi:sn-glycerol 3-phosphate transport system substrate-binding protein
MNRRLLPLALAGTASLVVAACSSGDSIVTSGNERTTTAPAVATTQPADDAPTGDASTGDGTAAGDTDTDTGDAGTAPPATNATTTTTPLAAFPDCPVDALAAADAPVEITFWHGLNVDNQTAVEQLVADYNASQDRVVVRPENQGGYLETIDKFFQSGVDDRPAVVMFPEYTVQRAIDSRALIPVEACTSAAGYDLSQFQPATITAYSAAGVDWGMPFNVSNPVLYYNKNMFVEAGLDPEQPPQSLEELRAYSQQLVDSGAAAYGIALDSGADSGGGWYIEQWFANMDELYADNGNGRLAPATEVLFDGPAGVEMLSFVQGLVTDGLAVYVGDNAGGADQLLKLADEAEPAAMAVSTSAGLGTVLNTLAGGLVPGLGPEDVGVGPLPGPSGTPTALVGGAALYVSDGKTDAETAAAWDFISYMVSAEAQSLFATLTGYVPVRYDALDVEPVLSVYRDDPRFRVAYDQLEASPDSPALQGPILGPQREIRAVVARAVAEIMLGGDVQTVLSAAAQTSNDLLAAYNASN